MNTFQFEERVKNGKCPFCEKKLKYYDGCLGYEAMKCEDDINCGFVVDNEGYHIERTKV